MQKLNILTKHADSVEQSQIDLIYNELLNVKASFAHIICNGKDYCLTKEQSIFEVDDWEEFTLNASKDEYFQTFTQKSVKKLKNLHLYKDLIITHKSKFHNNKQGFMFGCVAVRDGDGFITTVRGKKDLNSWTYVSQVDFKNKAVYVQGEKATLNAPLLAHMFKNPKVMAVLHFHEQNFNYPTYEYFFPGTIRDSVRNNKASFNIAHHGVFVLLDENLKVIDNSFNNKYPLGDVYEQMYKRYFARDPKELIELANVKKSDKVIDFCGGNGRLTNILTNFSDNVYYLDQEKDMISSDLKSNNVTVFNMSMEQFVASNSIKFDKAFCQQAINYWLKSVDIEKFANCFKTGGQFIFNTFNAKPSFSPSVKQYEINGKNFVEISYLIEHDVVQHIQICEGFEPHLTQFDYISREKFKEMLEKYFEIEIITKNKTDIYICTRK